jgi:protocatechuate 3,4-dioxygenase beta subunit
MITKVSAPSRRAFLGLAAKGAVSVVVSQSLFACAASGMTDSATNLANDTTTGGSDSTTCVGTAALTEGPYFVDEKLLRSDIRADVSNGTIAAGVPLTLRFNVSRITSNACTPLTGAYLDVWHCDPGGIYSDEAANGSSGRKFLRGYQITDANGAADFTTIYPGWYSGRAVHIHFKLRLFAGTNKTYEFTSQFFMVESLTSAVHANAPYNTRGQRNTLNSTDGIYNSLSAAQKSALTLATTSTADGHAGVINLGVAVG